MSKLTAFFYACSALFLAVLLGLKLLVASSVQGTGLGFSLCLAWPLFLVLGATEQRNCNLGWASPWRVWTLITALLLATLSSITLRMEFFTGELHPAHLLYALPFIFYSAYGAYALAFQVDAKILSHTYSIRSVFLFLGLVLLCLVVYVANAA
jgi:hypothetical protein